MRVSNSLLSNATDGIWIANGAGVGVDADKDGWGWVSKTSSDGDTGPESSSADESDVDARLGVIEVAATSGYKTVSLGDSAMTGRERVARAFNKDLAAAREAASLAGGPGTACEGSYERSEDSFGFLSASFQTLTNRSPRFFFGS